ncbi:hypothetical protein KDAU_26520 [Dictyobacter aurantiacus]|uniref:Uncharacterized protein n=1 Tax=Dictyobacter aurantiacus TaxID=1936993 RepID=A0A401ZES8_9CHLR|nr:hypothetical protein KDAU_26520 [Dictyobacter aurantiacus]
MPGLAQTEAASFTTLFTTEAGVDAGVVAAFGVAVAAGLAGVLFFACAKGG